MTIKAGETGICPHCKIANRFEEATDHNENPYSSMNITSGSADHNEILKLCRCTNPICGKNIIFFGGNMIHPLGSTRPPCPGEVPTGIAEDYKEACLVEHLSPKASAALARRCLQNMLRERGIKVESQKLFDEIAEAMKNLPPHLSGAIDSIRHIGNFASHPIKSKNTGLIVGVEPGEAEWNLDVIEQLFDFYYVQPVRTKSKKAALNVKLTATGKPKMK